MEDVIGRPSRSRWPQLLAGIAAIAALLAGVAAPAQAKPHGKQGKHGCSPGEPAGAPGVGDEYYPTYGNGGYDVRHYELDLAYDPATQLIEKGEATISAEATQSVCSFNLDLVGLDVRKVKVDGRKASITRTEHELTVTPKESLERGRSFETVIRYAGEPTEFLIPGTTIRTGFMDTPDGATVAGQPEVAAGWFPVNDHPRDKASYSFEVTVPDGYEVVANGFLRDTDSRGRGTTWEWEAREPMSSYLATIDIGFWDVSQRQTASGLPVYDAIDSAITGELRDQIEVDLGRQGEILDLLSGYFGPYPFRTVGGIVPNQDDLFFALETQTRPVYSKLFWLDDGNAVPNPGVVVHELAHQWFGDDVALHRWQDIWLNEGFASYAEWLFVEYEGQATTQEIFKATYDSIPADDPFWDVVIGDPGVEQLFAGAVYTRGAMTAQALRNEVGDQDFFAILKSWTSEQGGGTGTTDEFIALSERVSGEQLDELFDEWLFTGEKPEFSEPEQGQAARRGSAQAGAPDAGSWLDEVERRLQRHGRY